MEYPNQDILWKEAVSDLISDCIAFLLPDLYPNVDFSKGVSFLEQEFTTLFTESEEKVRYPDKLVKIFLIDGNEEWILIHCNASVGNGILNH